jgi:Fe2+ transport system protein B
MIASGIKKEDLEAAARARRAVEIIHESQPQQDGMNEVRQQLEMTQQQLEMTQQQLEMTQLEKKQAIAALHEQFHNTVTDQAKQLSRAEEKNTKLKQKIEKMKEEEAERLERAKTEALERMERQAQKLRNEFEKIKSSSMHRIPVPAYKMRLLTDFALNWAGCQIMLLEQEEEALLFGTDEECQEAKASLLKRVQVQFYV